jgi:hypothetical protein
MIYNQEDIFIRIFFHNLYYTIAILASVFYILNILIKDIKKRVNTTIITYFIKIHFVCKKGFINILNMFNHAICDYAFRIN